MWPIVTRAPDNAVNGVPSCASDWLLADVARGEWDFSFYPDNKVSFGYQDGKGGNSMWVASVGDTFDVDATAKQAITLTITVSAVIASLRRAGLISPSGSGCSNVSWNPSR